MMRRHFHYRRIGAVETAPITNSIMKNFEAIADIQLH